MTLPIAISTERMLRLHLYAYMRLAIGGSPTDEVSKALQQLCETTFPPGYPSVLSKMAPSRRPRPEFNSGAGVDYGFAPRERAFWIKRHFLSTFGFKDDAFDGRVFHQRGAEFAQTHGDEWLAGRLAIRLHEDDEKYLKRQSANTDEIRPQGLVVAGSLHGIVWIGTVRDRSILHETDGNVRALRIQQLVKHLRVQRTAQWPDVLTDAALSGMVRQQPAAFEQLALAEIERLAGSKYEGPVPVLNGVIDDFVGRILCVPVAPPANERDSNNALQVALSEAMTSNVDAVVIVSHLPANITAQNVERFALAHDHPTPRFIITDTRGITVLAADRPWTWSQTLGAHLPFRVLLAQDMPSPSTTSLVRQEQLTFLPVGLSEEELPPLPVKRTLFRESIPTALATATNILVTGRSGVGKSTALHHIVKRWFRDTVVITDAPSRNIDASDLPLLTAIIHDVVHDGSRVLIMLDDAEGPERAQLLRTFRTIQRRDPAGRVVILAAAGDALPEFADAHHVDLGYPGRHFHRRFVHHAARHYDVNMSEAGAEELAASAIRTRATAREMAEAIASHAKTTISPGTRISGFIDIQATPWKEKREQLSRDARRVLNILGLLRCFDWSIIHAETLVTYAHAMWQLDDAAGALRELEAHGWIVVNRSEIDCPHFFADLFAPHLSAHERSLPDDVTVRFIDATIDSTTVPADLKRQILGHLAVRDAFRARPEALLRIEKAYGALRPENDADVDPRWRTEIILDRAARLAQLGDLAAARETIAKFLGEGEERAVWWPRIAQLYAHANAHDDFKEALAQTANTARRYAGDAAAALNCVTYDVENPAQLFALNLSRLLLFPLRFRADLLALIADTEALGSVDWCVLGLLSSCVWLLFDDPELHVLRAIRQHPALRSDAAARLADLAARLDEESTECR